MVTTKTNVFAIALIIAFAMVLGAAALMPAQAQACYILCDPQPEESDPSDIKVKNKNSARVSNTVSVSASSGDNNANGGRGGDGGRRGDGGRGGNGGSITTWDATARADVSNRVNTNRTNIDPCGCEGVGDIKVSNRNRAYVRNNVTVDASSGGNDVNGGQGGDGGSDRPYRYRYHHYRGGADGGNGGRGGSIDSGPATAVAVVANVVNRNLTRIR